MNHTTSTISSPINDSLLRRPLILISFVLMCVALLPRAEAVSPAPDGGYPGGNTAEGQNALLVLSTGTFNTAVGFLSLTSDTTGSLNTAIGAGALLANTADQITAIGAAALFSNTTGESNTANGAFALSSNTIGSRNTANGFDALAFNTTGFDNTAIGSETLVVNNGGSNTATGSAALNGNTDGFSNTANGFQALVNSTTGNFNTAIGANALSGSGFTGASNTAVGAFAGSAVTTANNVICIGTSVVGANVSNSCFIGNIRGATTINNNAVQVLIDSAGQLGTLSSSRRFKRDINPMDKASEAILALKPVTFHYKTDKTNRPEFGLIAEEVAQVNPELVVRDENGDIYTVRYEAVNAMLLNEFLKEHRKVQELEANAEQQQAQIEALTAGLQKVSAQLEGRKPAPRVVTNDQ
jgi:hypothetical protein